MKTQEKVSVIVPLYNAAPFIEETIHSILSQRMKDFVMYVVDDFSTDESPTIVKRLAQEDDRVRYVMMEKRGGCPAPTKNTGVRLAQGEYIAFCDNDDWWDPTKLEKQVKYLDTHSEVTMLGCNVEIVDTEHHRSLGTFWKNPTDFQVGRLREIVLEGPIYATTTCLMLRKSFALMHPFDEQFIGCDEYDLSLHAVLDNPQQVAMLPETLAFWRWHMGSLSHSDKAAMRALKDERQFTEKLLARADLSEEEREQVKRRLRLVVRRAGNAELAAGRIEQARTLYLEANDKWSQYIMAILSVAPFLARSLVIWKRKYSHAKPAFR